MGSSSSKQTVGYKYSIGKHSILGHGPVDAILNIKYGGRSAWSGVHSASGPLYIDKPNLLGGEEKEGGIQGTIDFDFGESDQGANAYLSSVIDGPMPAFRGVLSAIANQIYFAAMNPYMKDWWYRVQRCYARQFEWYPEKVSIDGHMNPAHICVDVYTNSEWGNGGHGSDLDLDSFLASADTLHSEGFGLSFYWNKESSAGDFLDMVMDHIGGLIYESPEDGRLTLKLVRDDYDPGTIPLFNTDNAKMLSFQRQSIGHTINEMVVIYTNDETGEDAATAPIHNIGNIQAQGGQIVSKTNRYPGVYDPELAGRLAARDLRVLSTPLAKAVVETSLDAWDIRPGDPIRLTFADEELTDAVFRVLVVDEGTLEDPAMKLTVVQDVFGLPSGSYVRHQTSLWIDTKTTPTDLVAVEALETPYYDAAINLSTADFNNLDPDWGFGYTFAEKEAGDSTNYRLLVSSDNVTFNDAGSGDFTPTAQVFVDIDYLDTTIKLQNLTGLDSDLVGEYAYLFSGADFEMVEVTGVDLVNDQITVKRGVLDTVPRQFESGDRLWFSESLHGLDEVERVLSEAVYYKLLPVTSGGILDEGSATSHQVTMNNRAQRPYPPGNVTLNTLYHPATIYGDVTADWAHRDKTQQTAGYDAWVTGDIGPEAGVDVTVRVKNKVGTLIHTESGLTGTTYTYTMLQEQADHGQIDDQLTFEVVTVLGGLECLTPFIYTFARLRNPIDFNLTVDASTPLNTFDLTEGVAS